MEAAGDGPRAGDATRIGSLPHKELVPNKVLKSIIQEWEEEKHKECMADDASRLRVGLSSTAASANL